MTVTDVQSRQRIVEEFKRRRAREIMAMIPLLAAVFVLYLAWEDPAFRVGGLSGPPLLLACAAVIAACLVHHAVNWRCPVCKANFWAGFQVPFCPRCRAVFTEAGESHLLPDAEAERRARMEAAVQTNLGQYRGKYILDLMKAVVIVIVGLIMVFLLADAPDALKPDSILIRKLGPEGAHMALKALGGLVVLTGLAWAAWAVYALRRAGRHGEEIRRFLEGSDGR
jgi:hypothetical protein